MKSPEDLARGRRSERVRAGRDAIAALEQIQVDPNDPSGSVVVRPLEDRGAYVQAQLGEKGRAVAARSRSFEIEDEVQPGRIERVRAES